MEKSYARFTMFNIGLTYFVSIKHQIMENLLYIMKRLNNVFLSFLIASSTSGVALAEGEQGQGSGKVVFHGYIIDAPCTIVSDNPIQVEFGQISRKVLAANGNTGESHIQPFNIELADCSFEEGQDGTYVKNQVAITFSYTDAGTITGEEGKPETIDMVGLDGKENIGAGVVITSGNTRVKNNVPLPLKSLQAGPNTLEFSSYVKGIGLPDVDGQTPIKTGEFYATANFSLAYQ
ncbi:MULTISPECIES: fimbrial protein [Enterobacterales]|uniref:fimbrial protein n=1 Tax=Enterobacterales TaxID=91347 RepID=UPI0012F0E3D0|nr:fimbrial protein [Morganella morganii]EBR0130263.1 type 1 fimbrial protein [Salmonella enterica subsp. enterica serovar Ajiobo]MBT0473618.1 type 1 fimbrial protein [Morganella morganii subsp. morganii]UMW89878.1 hypothetical protein [Morganella morganii]HCT1400044.1 type 1 fimbrial protein [Morganella morganii]